MRQAVDNYNDTITPRPPPAISPALAASRFYQTGSLPRPVLESFEDEPTSIVGFQARHKTGMFKNLGSRLKTAIAKRFDLPIDSLHFKDGEVCGLSQSSTVAIPDEVI